MIKYKWYQILPMEYDTKIIKIVAEYIRTVYRIIIKAMLKILDNIYTFSSVKASFNQCFINFPGLIHCFGHVLLCKYSTQPTALSVQSGRPLRTVSVARPC